MYIQQVASVSYEKRIFFGELGQKNLFPEYFFFSQQLTHDII
jgi:hypothetical protein